jgi:hypothetical protein
MRTQPVDTEARAGGSEGVSEWAKERGGQGGRGAGGREGGLVASARTQSQVRVDAWVHPRGREGGRERGNEGPRP